jgi:hypothetical protein
MSSNINIISAAKYSAARDSIQNFLNKSLHDSFLSTCHDSDSFLLQEGYIGPEVGDIPRIRPHYVMTK